MERDIKNIINVSKVFLLFLHCLIKNTGQYNNKEKIKIKQVFSLIV